MPLLPADPLSLVGLAAIAATILALLASDWPRAYVLGISNLLLYALQFASQWTGTGRVGLDALALSTDQLVAGAWWSPITYAFLHGSLFHIFGNLFILLTAGPALEDSVGPRWFLIIYALAGLAAAGAGLGLSLVTDIVDPSTLMIGASGSIFGVLTAYAVRHPREKLPIILIFLVVWLPSMTVLLIYLAMNIAYMFTNTSVAWYGHFAGFLAGLALANVPGLKQTTDPPTQRLDPSKLAHLAGDPSTQEALEHLADLQPGEEEVAHAWLDVLARENRCPVCQAPLGRKGLRIVCQQGHDMATVPEQARG